MILDFTDQRDNDLRKAEKAVIERLGSNASYVSRRCIIKMVCEEPAPHYYVSQAEAMRVISRMRKGGSTCKKGQKNQMFQALYKTYQFVEKYYPGLGCAELVDKAINTPAPGFFMNEEYVYSLLNRKP